MLSLNLSAIPFSETLPFSPIVCGIKTQLLASPGHFPDVLQFPAPWALCGSQCAGRLHMLCLLTENAFPFPLGLSPTHVSPNLCGILRKMPQTSDHVNLIPAVSEMVVHQPFISLFQVVMSHIRVAATLMPPCLPQSLHCESCDCLPCSPFLFQHRLHT